MPRRRATTSTARRLALVGGPANSRVFVYLTGNYLRRIERERRQLYFGDLDLALVAEIIGTAGVEPGMRDAAFRHKHRDFDTAIAVDEQPTVNELDRRRHWHAERDLAPQNQEAASASSLRRGQRTTY